MKTKNIITAALIVLFSASFAAQAAAPKKTLSFFDAAGRKLTMPAFVEEAREDMPFDQATIFNQTMNELRSRQIDLRPMTKAEAPVNDIPESLQDIIPATSYQLPATS